MHCPVCRAHHVNCHGLKCFVEAECPVCMEKKSPFMMLPCGHGTCEEDFQALGGSMPSGSPDEQMINRVGDPVALGTSRGSMHLYYCGRDITGSDRTCGPNNGPQCPDCLGMRDFTQVLNRAGLPVMAGTSPSCRHLYYCG
ncbi:unnamed protein product, partial [Polarella glacialis]